VLRVPGRQFASPVVLILVLGALVSAALRDWVEATVILATEAAKRAFYRQRKT